LNGSWQAPKKKSINKQVSFSYWYKKGCTI
jgi:hypothetical protein